MDGRIIPARAGFTSFGLVLGLISSDHPRSRGVYGGCGGFGRSDCGSSPLARGLRTPHDGTVHRPGIIPARAGFTSRGTVRPTESRDHPRSRGVYALIPFQIVTIPGSSPLARGLHRHGPVSAPGCGIIPARAGFTLTPWAPSSSGSDHPRSRGVYDTSAWMPLRSNGSSPLARGLPRPPGTRSPRRRIIPARAGFTGR